MSESAAGREKLSLLLPLLSSQLDSFLAVMAADFARDLHHKPDAGGWTAHEHLAHLGRYHEIFLSRAARILAEANPALPRYRAEEDPEWESWRVLSTPEVLSRMRSLRTELVMKLSACSDDQFQRTGVHPRFGALALEQWLEFFLVHEGHHLYTIFGLLRNMSQIK